MEFSTKHKFLFFAIPKTGSTAVRKILARYSDKIDFRKFYHLIKYDPLHINQHTAKKIFTESGVHVNQNYFEFVIVRNPYDKVISHISYGINSNNPPTHPINYNNIDAVLDIYEENVKHDNWIGKNNSYYMFCPQMYWTTDTITSNLKIYHYEEIDKAWDDIRIKLNLDLPNLPVVNVTGPKITLTQSQKDRIYDILKQDFKTFNYDK